MSFRTARLSTAFICVALPLVVGAQDNKLTETPTTNVHTFLAHTLRDQREDFVSFPTQVMHGKHLVPVLAVLGVTAGLVVADQYDTAYFRRHTTNSTFNSVFSSGGTAAGLFLTPVVFYSAGHFSHSNYARQTALLTAEAAVDGEVADLALKLITDRSRPAAFQPGSNYADSFEEGNSRLNSSFPSAHAVVAFSMATVISRRYGRLHKWVPPLAYGLATAVGFSRISSSAHFPSDVFFGAAVGYSIGRFTVVRQ